MFATLRTRSAKYMQLDRLPEEDAAGSLALAVPAVRAATAWQQAVTGAIEIVPFDRRWDRSAFACGQTDLDEWLRTQSRQAQDRHNARTFLAVREGSTRVAGYYTTLADRLELDEVASAIGSGRRRYPIPAVLLARLAVDRAVQGQGLGGMLLSDALGRIGAAASFVGFEMVVVDAIDEAAATFYRYFGFTPFCDSPDRLFLTTKDLLATLDTTT